MSIKDDNLNQKAQTNNIAKFISFTPNLPLKHRHMWFSINGHQKTVASKKSIDLIEILLKNAPDGVNVRSFKPDQPKGNTFIYGLKSSKGVMDHLEDLASKGFHTIVNETIPVDDNGVSGVVLGELMEFSPDDTPKCVEKPDCCALPRDMGMRLLRTIYGFTPDLAEYPPQMRVEFSIHPLRRGIRQTHTIIWETESVRADALPEAPSIRWPNRFSRLLGDKAYGLLIAHLLGATVPETTVIGRRLAPFTFGTPTGSYEVWMRTCPTHRTPGKYPTTLGWQDPFVMMEQWPAKADGTPSPIASVMAQKGVTPYFSGSLVPVKNKPPVIEGVKGRGDDFMVGTQSPEKLPKDITASVQKVYDDLSATLGPIEMEWVYDGKRVWVVQLHSGGAITDPKVIYPGTPDRWVEFPVSDGLDALRSLISKVKNTSTGIRLIGRVGITSHFGDLLRSAAIPSRLIDG